MKDRLPASTLQDRSGVPKRYRCRNCEVEGRGINKGSESRASVARRRAERGGGRSLVKILVVTSLMDDVMFLDGQLALRIHGGNGDMFTGLGKELLLI